MRANIVVRLRKAACAWDSFACACSNCHKINKNQASELRQLADDVESKKHNRFDLRQMLIWMGDSYQCDGDDR